MANYTYIKAEPLKKTRLQPAKALTHKQQAFVAAYLETLNGAEAIRRAGYNAKYPEKLATEFLHHPTIRPAIDEALSKKAKRNEISVDYVIQKLISIVEDTDKDNPQAALRGLELLGKHLGMYRDRQEISGPDGKAIETMQRKREDVDDFTDKLSGLIESRQSIPSPDSSVDDADGTGRVVSLVR